MGQQLVKVYDFVEDEKGLVGKMELAKRTKIPSTLAASVPDTPENVRKFMEAAQAITGKPPPR